MQICEFHQQESYDNITCFEGRWHWRICDEGSDDGSLITIEWIDFFRQEESVKFTSKEPLPYVEELKVIPLNLTFGLASALIADYYDTALRLIEFDREKKEFIIYDNDFGAHLNPVNWDTVSDQNPSFVTNDGLDFITYDEIPRFYRHCRVDVQNRQIVQIGSSFQLPADNFNYLSLKSGIFSGISESLDTVNRFDLKTRQFLDKIKIYGLPPTVRSMWNANTKRNLCCWTTYNQLFVCSVETVNGQEFQYYKLHCANLETGQTETLSHKFRDKIHNVYQNSEDGNLYIKTSRYYKTMKFNEQDELVEAKTGEEATFFLHMYHFYRIPLNEPESLFFTAFKNVPKPLPPIVEKLALMRKGFPMNVY